MVAVRPYYRLTTLFSMEIGTTELAATSRIVDDVRVVITADHGEAFGGWGAYGHPMGMMHPAVRRVP